MLYVNFGLTEPKANLLTEKISKNSMGIYLFHSPLVYISFTYWPNIAPMAMAAINLIGFGSVAYMLTNLIRATNMGWIIGETPRHHTIRNRESNSQGI